MFTERQQKINDLIAKQRNIETIALLEDLIAEVSSVRIEEFVDSPPGLPSIDYLWREFNGVESDPDTKVRVDTHQEVINEWLKGCVEKLAPCNEVAIFIGGYGDIPWIHLFVTESSDWLIEIWKTMQHLENKDWIIFCYDTKIILAITEEEYEYYGYIRRLE